MPGGRTGSVSWYSRDPSLNVPELLAAHSDVLFVAAHCFMDLLHRIRAEEGLAAELGSPLTERELECLARAALGHTDNEIGSALNRSPTTARFHMDNAVRKLGARNRTHAVAIAVRRGLIHPLEEPSAVQARPVAARKTSGG